MASKGITAAHGSFGWPFQNYSETTFASTVDTAAIEVKNRDRSPSLKETKKLMDVEGKYNRFTIRRVPVQDVPFAFIIWYVAKTICLS